MQMKPMDKKTKTKKLTNIEVLTEISKKLSLINGRLIKIEDRLNVNDEVEHLSIIGVNVNNDIDNLSITEMHSLRDIARSIFTDNNHHEGNTELLSQSRKLINKLNLKIEDVIRKYNESI